MRSRLFFLLFCASCSSSSSSTSEPTDTGSASDDSAATDTAVATDTGTSTTDSATTTDSVGSDTPASDAPTSTLSFFITSKGLDGGNLGGLDGADAHCKTLATAVGAGGKTWRAYLGQQATGGKTAINPKDRIGKGPWFNAKGVKIASDVAELHGMNNIKKDTALTEKGEVVKGRGDTPNQHDILTGSKLDGTVSTDAADSTCKNWTSNTTGAATVGHHDRDGGGTNPTSWNSAHNSSGCSPANLVSTGGNGYFYCFAAD
jgi:hypothetical protein